MSHRAFTLPLLLALLSPSTALAADYYVDSVGGNDARDGRTAATAWRSIDHLEMTVTLRAGDNVYFRAGSDFDVSARGDGGLALRAAESGTAAAPITLTRYGDGARPILRNTRIVTSSAQVITLQGSYVVVSGLELADAHLAAVSIDTTAAHVIVRDCEMHHVGVGVVVDGPDALITHNVLRDGTMVRNTMGGTDDYGANGLVISGARAEVSYNRAERLRAPSFDFGTDGGFVELYGAVTDLSVHHNVVIDSDGFLEGGSGSGETLARGIIAFNESIDNTGFSTLHNGGDGFSGVWVDFIIANNTIYESAGTSIFWFSANATAGSVTFTNNIVYTVAGRMYQRGGAVTHTHNLYPAGVTIGLTADPTEITGSPLFVDAATRDLHLRSTSPAIDVGTATRFTTDLDGVPVPTGRGVDLGAHEYLAPSSDAGVMRDAAIVLDAAFVLDAGSALDAGALDAFAFDDAGEGDAGVDRDASANDAMAFGDAATPDAFATRDASLGVDAGAGPIVGGCGCSFTRHARAPWFALIAFGWMLALRSKRGRSA